MSDFENEQKLRRMKVEEELKRRNDAELKKELNAVYSFIRFLFKKQKNVVLKVFQVLAWIFTLGVIGLVVYLIISSK